jgi:hypothetical protein
LSGLHEYANLLAQLIQLGLGLFRYSDRFPSTLIHDFETDQQSRRIAASVAQFVYQSVQVFPYISEIEHRSSSLTERNWRSVAPSISYVLIAIVMKELKLDASLCTCLQILPVSIFEKTGISSALQPYQSQNNLHSGKDRWQSQPQYPLPLRFELLTGHHFHGGLHKQFVA